GKQQQMARYEKQLNEATAKKEYDALRAEIASARKDVQRLEDEILDAMAEGEEVAARLPALEQAVAQAKADLAQYERDSGPRLAALAREREKVLAELAAVEANVPAEVRESYERQGRSRGEDALGAVEDRTRLGRLPQST